MITEARNIPVGPDYKAKRKKSRQELNKYVRANKHKLKIKKVKRMVKKVIEDHDQCAVWKFINKLLR